MVQAVGTVQITLVQQDNDLTALQRRDGRDTVNQERVGFGNGAGGDDHQLVNVGHGRPGKSVLPGEDGFYEALSVSQLPHFHPVAHQRRDAVFAELAPGATGQDLRAGIHIVEAAEGFLNTSFTHINQRSDCG